MALQLFQSFLQSQYVSQEKFFDYEKKIIKDKEYYVGENGKLIEKGNYKQGLKIGTWYKFNEKGILTEEFTYDDSGRFLFDIKYYNNGNVKRYRDYFSKTIQEYNYDGSQKGELKTF